MADVINKGNNHNFSNFVWKGFTSANPQKWDNPLFIKFSFVLVYFVISPYSCPFQKKTGIN